MNKQLLQGHLQTLLRDCESQEHSLRQCLGNSWDTLEISNWAAMVTTVLAIAEELNISLETNNDED